MHIFLDERDKELIDGQIDELTNNVSELKGDLVDYLCLEKDNSYEKITENYYVDKRNGTLVQNTIADHTMYSVENIPVIGGNVINLKWFNNVALTGNRGYAFFDEAGKYISGDGYTSGITEYEIDVPQNAYLFSFTLFDGVGYKITYKNRIIEDDIKIRNLQYGKADKYIKEIEQTETEYNSSKVYNSNGELVTSGSANACAKYMVGENAKVLISGFNFSDSQPFCTIWNKDGERLDVLTGGQGYTDFEYITPQNTSYILVNGRNRTLEHLKNNWVKLVEYADINQEYLDNKIENIETKIEPLFYNSTIKDKTCISDTFEYTASHNPNCVIDENKGILYTVYLAGHGYGDTADCIALSVSPLVQPFRTKYFEIVRFSEFGQVADPVAILINNKLRIFFTSVVKAPSENGLYFVDFDIETNEISQVTMCNFNSDVVNGVLSSENFLAYMSAKGKSPNYQNFFIIGSHMVKHNGAYYCNIDIPSTGGYPLIIKTTDNGVTFTPCGIVPSVNIFESDLCFVGNDMYVLLRQADHSIYVSSDGGTTFTSYMDIVDKASVRPRIISYDNKALLAYSKAEVSKYDIASSRTNIYFYLGIGTNANDYQNIYYAFDDMGVAVVDVINYNGILYMVYGNSELFAISKGSSGKDSLFFTKIGDLR